VAASLLNAVGLPELITRDLKAYEALALGLATNPETLRSFRQRLATNRMTYPLFDTRLFAKHIESAYVAMWKRHQAGLAPGIFMFRLRPEPVVGPTPVLPAPKTKVLTTVFCAVRNRSEAP
jgi:hypothetical protein